MNTKLVKALKELVKKDKKIREYKRRLRVRGKVVKKSLTKNGNIRLLVRKEGEEVAFIVIKSHKERFELAQKLKEGSSVYAEGARKLRMLICTRLKRTRTVIESKQRELGEF